MSTGRHQVQITEQKSAAELSAFIESYWRYEGHRADDLILVPDGTFSVLFAQDGFSCSGRFYPRGMYVLPILLNSLVLHASTVLMAIRFKAFSMPNLFPTQVLKANHLYPFRELCSAPSLFRLGEQILAERDPDAAAQNLQLFAYECLSPKLSVHHSLREKVNYILDRRGQVRIDEMAAHFGISRQGLHKHFTASVHISPKQLSTIWQLNHFFTLANRADETLTANALDAGYYDQAHLIRQFSAFFGVAPSTFLRFNKGMLSFAKDNMIRRFSNYYDPE